MTNKNRKNGNVISLRNSNVPKQNLFLTLSKNVTTWNKYTRNCDEIKNTSQ